MLYQPNFCCQCGNKIERTKWKLWTSRRFCENCEKDFRKEDWTLRIVALISIIIGIFGIGSYLKTPEKPLNVMANQVVPTSSNKIQNVKTEPVLANNSNQNRTIVNANAVNKVNEQTTHNQPNVKLNEVSSI